MLQIRSVRAWFDSALLFMPEVSLWRPETFSLYAGKFAEEFIELGAMEPTADDPARLAR